MRGMYKGLDRREVGVVGIVALGKVGTWLCLLLGLFRVAMYPKVPAIGPEMPGLRDVSLTLEPISDPYLPYITLHSPHCLSCNFKYSAKLTLENSYIW